jgi:hypothetical protein
MVGLEPWLGEGAVKIEITFPGLTPRRAWILVGAALIATSGLVLIQMGFATWLLLLAFCLLLLAIGLLWSSVTTIGEGQEVSLEEALDLAAPARDEERKLAVLRGIKDLEYERGLGKVSEQDYQQLSQRYRRDARRLLERLDSSEASFRQRALDLVAEKLAREEAALGNVDRNTTSAEHAEPTQPVQPEASSRAKDSDA